MKFMLNLKISDKLDADGICIIDGNKSQSNIASKPVITAFVVANMIALSTLGAISPGKTLSTSKYLVETKNMTSVEYPSLNLGSIEGIKNKENVIPQVKIENGKKLVYGNASGIIIQNDDSELRREIAMLKNRLNNCLPIHALLYIAGSSAIAVLAIALLLLRYVSGVYTVDPYFIICALIIALTLLSTAVVSLKDWKNFLHER